MQLFEIGVEDLTPTSVIFHPSNQLYALKTVSAMGRSPIKWQHYLRLLRRVNPQLC